MLRQPVPQLGGVALEALEPRRLLGAQVRLDRQRVRGPMARGTAKEERQAVAAQAASKARISFTTRSTLAS